MSKVVVAECVAGVVKVGGFPVDATILTAGTGSSSGIAVLQNDELYYIASNTTDLDTTLAKVIDALTKIGEGLTQIGTSLTSIAAVTGPVWTPPPTIAADVVTILSKVTAVTADVVALTSLKGMLK